MKLRTKRRDAHNATAAAWFSTFLLNAFVSLVNLRIDMRIVRFCRSTFGSN